MNNDQLTTLIGIIVPQFLELGGLPISLLMALQGYFTNKRSLPKHPEDTLESINSKDL